VERIHRQLKAALKARLVGPAWVDELPLVLLGLRSAPKEGLRCASAKLVYGTTIRLPGEFFECTPTAAEPDTSDLLTHLRNTMARLRLKQTSHHRRPSTHIPVELQSCTFVFIRHDTHRTPLPTDITSDRGPQFTSNLWTSLGKLLVAQLHHTTAYHPQANGIVERIHRQLKAALKARLVGPAWVDELPLVLLGLRSAPKEGLGCASAELRHNNLPTWGVLRMLYSQGDV